MDPAPSLCSFRVLEEETYYSLIGHDPAFAAQATLLPEVILEEGMTQEAELVMACRTVRIKASSRMKVPELAI